MGHANVGGNVCGWLQRLLCLTFWKGNNNVFSELVMGHVRELAQKTEANSESKGKKVE